ncbi:MAG TPA: hypothetical protein VF648_09035 [Pyrinomonadaceae bacterium]
MIDILIKILDLLGLPKGVVSQLTLFLLLLSLLILILKSSWAFIRYLMLIRDQRLLNKDLTPYYSKQDVERATRYYIPTKYQNVSPSEDDEPGRSYIASAKNELIPLFLNNIFDNGVNSNRFYLILADSGMGKTTFLINLYVRYKNRFENLFGIGKQPTIHLFPLGAPDVFSKIEKIENKESAILLLDAFDEDIKAVDNHKTRMEEILSKVWEFKEIIITCRTQFFPSVEEEPNYAGYFTFGDGGEYKFQKLYLSVFDDKDVKKYLKKRFPFFLKDKRKKAKKIVEKCPNLVVRPMLLSYINDLLDSDKNFEYSSEIYEILIDKWIKRESEKSGIREKYGSSENYQKLLFEFSQALAVDLYENSKERGGYFISKNEKILNTANFQLSDIENLASMTELETKSKSLLNRSSGGQYKFSHKSILEYFLAKEMIKNAVFLIDFDFDGMDASKNFYEELLHKKLIECEAVYGSKIEYPSETIVEVKPIKEINPKKINNIPALIIQNLNDFDPLYLCKLENLRILIMFDAVKYSFLYKLHFYLFYNEMKLGTSELRTFRKLRKTLNQTKQKHIQYLINQLKHKEIGSKQTRMLTPYDIEDFNYKEGVELIARINRLELNESINYLGKPDDVKLKHLPKSIEDLQHFKQQDLQFTKELESIVQYFILVHLLEMKLNQCKIFY